MPPIPVANDKNASNTSQVPPPGAPPPLPPAPLDLNKPVEIAEETAAKEVIKKEKKPQGSLPTRAWAVVKKEAAHYWAGTKLLGQEIKISAKLLHVVLKGDTLTRRERRQVGSRLVTASRQL